MKEMSCPRCRSTYYRDYYWGFMCLDCGYEKMEEDYDGK